MKIVEQIEAVAAEICKDYCKWPDSYEIFKDEDMDRMNEKYKRILEEKCNNCPFNKLI